ncbi:hypothetical protein ACON2I_002042 [Listeria monocytogenes]|uniref:Uncharacterized protein n=1 Tax=Listeria monocytogenes TaxID=1639 RepID=A0AAD2RCJ4_LISMN|nr:hypothetical protein [Listeria monocytogenes]EAA0055227.1 hypothetical protein [Listeria monocytogenes]EAA0075652.1 hypothetical protein [Listeria monocytogenes]EAA0385187.1 hypothetical protein [Listeria monocytogenes]EAC2545805.1 hypothetical protein [Listeria monocytogenes]EAC3009443.1 hypothetical protein [Listeria monocytogenes]
MSSFLTGIGSLGVVIGVVYLIICAVRKRPKKIAIFIIMGAFLINVIGIETTPSAVESVDKQVKSSKKVNNRLTSNDNYSINNIKLEGEFRGKHVEVIVKEKISKKQSIEIVKKVTDKYNGEEDALYLNMHYFDGPYPAILNARHSYNKTGIGITGLKVDETDIEMADDLNKKR